MLSIVLPVLRRPRRTFFNTNKYIVFKHCTLDGALKVDYSIVIVTITALLLVKVDQKTIFYWV